MVAAPDDLTRRVLARCRELGFALAGVADATPTSYGPELKAWLGAGKHGEMSWFFDELDVRLDPARLLCGARAVIMVADRYADRAESASERPGADPAPRGRIARYARGGDYHRVIKRRLHYLADELRILCPGHHFRSFVDTAPILEREYAARAGLGWIGKHTLLIHPREGSYVLLGGVATTLNLSPPQGQTPVPDRCGTCTRCIDACPTDAITPYSVDATRCISYLTIEQRAPIAPALFGPIGGNIFGCDICQEVCPHNSARNGEPDFPNPAYIARRDSFDLLEVLGWTSEERRAVFEASPMKRARLDMMKRNALIVAGNAVRASPATTRALRERILALAADESEPELVRGTAAAVMDSIRAREEGSVDTGPVKGRSEGDSAG